MKRKKLNFDVINTSLNRSELREITAGCTGSGGGGGGGGCSCNTANTAICYCGNGSIEEHCALPTSHPMDHCNCYSSYTAYANWGITQWCCDQFCA